MLKAFERGLTLRDFEIMTFGMIIDYIITYNNVYQNDGEKEGTASSQTSIRMATQADFDAF
jgi:hypothetical protein